MAPVRRPETPSTIDFDFIIDHDPQIRRLAPGLRQRPQPVIGRVLVAMADGDEVDVFVFLGDFAEVEVAFLREGTAAVA